MEKFTQNKPVAKKIASPHFGAFVAVIMILLYHLTFWNRFFPLQEGWFSVYADQIISGKIPYKDFYVYLQPLYPLLVTALIYVFGKGFIVLRALGLVEVSLLTLILYLLLSKLLSWPYAILATLTTIFIYTSATTDVVYSYYQASLLFILLASYFLYIYFIKKEGRISFIWLVLSGFFSGLAFLTKQSTGIILSIVLISFLFIVSLKLKKRQYSSLLYFGAGWIFPVFVILSWLYLKGAYSFYIQQVFKDVSSSKGSFLVILFGFLKRALLPEYILLFSIFVLLLGLDVLLKKRYGPKTIINTKYFYVSNYSIVFLGFLLFLLIPRHYNLFNQLYVYLNFYKLKLAFVHLAFYFSIIALAYFFIKFKKEEYDHKNVLLFLLSFISFAIMFSHGFSFTIEEHAVVPAFGLMLACAINYRSALNNLKNTLVVIICVLIIFLSGVQKYVWPYEWWGWREPIIAQAVEKPKLALLKYFYLSKQTNEVFNEVTTILNRNVSSKDKIYTFPSIPIFYFLTGRYPDTFSQIHYFDVCPDKIAIRDAEILLKNPPKAIVYLEFPEDAWRFHEDAFRGGKASGQRKIEKVVKKLVKNNNYFLAKSFTTSVNYKLKVWLKK